MILQIVLASYAQYFYHLGRVGKFVIMRYALKKKYKLW